MRHTKRALLLFGAGGLLGLVLVLADLSGLGWAASATMAAGIGALPAALVADWWSHRPWRKPAPKRRARSPQQTKSSPSRKRRPRNK